MLPPPLRTTLLSHATIGFSLGYFVVDVLVMALTPGLAGIEMFVHHAIAMLGLYTCNAVSGKEWLGCGRVSCIVLV